MILTEPQPFTEAIESAAIKKVLPTDLKSRDLAKLSSDIHERSFLSAQTLRVDYLQEFQTRIAKLLQPETKIRPDGSKFTDGTDPATVRMEMQQFLKKIGHEPDPDKRGTLEDLSSDARIDLIVDMQTGFAYGYGNWKQSQDPDLLDVYPAQELYRAIQSKEPRDWIQRWSDAGGEFFDGRMIALKNDPIWINISAFGTPYPPFDFNSGMDIRDIDREEAIAIGLISETDEAPEPEDRPFNEELQVGVESLDKKFQELLLKEMGRNNYELREGVLRKKARKK